MEHILSLPILNSIGFKMSHHFPLQIYPYTYTSLSFPALALGGVLFQLVYAPTGVSATVAP